MKEIRRKVGNNVSEAILLIASDFIISFSWIWSGILLKIFATNVLFLRHGVMGEIFRCALSIVNMFFFAYLGKLTNGGTYNPLTVLPGVIIGNFRRFIFTVVLRIPAQVLGSITGVWLILLTFPEIGCGPRLNVDIHHGALTEGFLAFTIVFIYLGLSKSMCGSFFRKTWISSISKLTLHILGSDLTGGCMNPASAMGWAFARGDHISKEQLLVYWLAPIEATLLAVWLFRLLVQPGKKEEKMSQMAKKSD